MWVKKNTKLYGWIGFDLTNCQNIKVQYPKCRILILIPRLCFSLLSFMLLLNLDRTRKFRAKPCSFLSRYFSLFICLSTATVSRAGASNSSLLLLQRQRLWLFHLWDWKEGSHHEISNFLHSPVAPHLMTVSMQCEKIMVIFFKSKILAAEQCITEIIM